MKLLLKASWPYLLSGFIVLAAFLFFNWYGDKRYDDGVASERLANRAAAAELSETNRKLTEALATARNDIDKKGEDVAKQYQAFIDGKLNPKLDSLQQSIAVYKRRIATSTRSESQANAEASEWADLFGSCAAEYKYMATEAGRHADTVNWWIDYGILIESENKRRRAKAD